MIARLAIVEFKRYYDIYMAVRKEKIIYLKNNHAFNSRQRSAAFHDHTPY